MNNKSIAITAAIVAVGSFFAAMACDNYVTKVVNEDLQKKINEVKIEIESFDESKLKELDKIEYVFAKIRVETVINITEERIKQKKKVDTSIVMDEITFIRNIIKKYA